jgi:hypothetical protein
MNFSWDKCSHINSFYCADNPFKIRRFLISVKIWHLRTMRALVKNSVEILLLAQLRLQM